MAGATWFFYKYYPREQMIIVPLFVTIEHLIMYFYYFVTALGPRFQGIIRWKKLTTRLQILQFVLMITYFVSTLYRGCRMEPKLTYLLMVNTLAYLVLYIKFYQKLYGKHGIEDFEPIDNNNDDKTLNSNNNNVDSIKKNE